jgi:hypothetical protein
MRYVRSDDDEGVAQAAFAGRGEAAAYLASLLALALFVIIALVSFAMRYGSGRASHVISVRSWAFWVLAAVGAVGGYGVDQPYHRAIRRLYGPVLLRSRRSFAKTSEGHRVRRIVGRHGIPLALNTLRGGPGRQG